MKRKQMNTYTRKERLTSLILLATARQAVQGYATPCDESVATEAVLLLAAEYARNGACLAVIEELTYERDAVLPSSTCIN